MTLAQIGDFAAIPARAISVPRALLAEPITQLDTAQTRAICRALTHATGCSYGALAAGEDMQAVTLEQIGRFAAVS